MLIASKHWFFLRHSRHARRGRIEQVVDAWGCLHDGEFGGWKAAFVLGQQFVQDLANGLRIMSSSPRCLERDLFELGDTSHRLIERAHGFWFVGTEAEFATEASGQVPGVLQDLVSELHAALQDLAEKGLGTDVEDLAQENHTRRPTSY